MDTVQSYSKWRNRPIAENLEKIRRAQNCVRRLNRAYGHGVAAWLL